MQVSFSALDQQHTNLLPELLPSIENVLRTSAFILGKPVEEFEKKFAAYHNMPYAIGVNSGTDALILALRALDIKEGDEVITTANTFITTVSSIVLVGAKPVLVDVGPDDNIDVNQIERHINAKTKAILPVHWTGRPCDMDKIVALTKNYGLRMIEDCAQAISATYKGQKVGTFGGVGCFSLHPFKTLNACGDAGIIITIDGALNDKIRALRQNGLTPTGACHVWSNNSRLDTIQATILNVKLNHFEAWTKRRVEIANYYSDKLKDLSNIITPPLADDKVYPVFHTYIIKAEQRDKLKNYLQENGIETRIHYPVPIYKQPAAVNMLHCRPSDFPNMEKVSNSALSLPIYPELDQEQQDYIIEKIKSFYHTKCSNLFEHYDKKIINA